MDFSVDEQVNEHQLILALRLTEEVLAFVESAHSPHLDWATIARQLAPHRHPSLTPRECRALWRKLAYRNSNTNKESSSSRQFAGAHESEERMHDGSDGYHSSEHHQETRDREEDAQSKGARGKKKRKSKEGPAGKRRREALEAQPRATGGEDDGSAGFAEGPGTAEKRPRTSSSGDPEQEADATLSGIKPLAATESTSTTPTPTLPRANGGNPLGTPLPDPSADTAAGGSEAHGKGPRKRTMWTNEEDILLLRGVQRNGEGNWAAILRDQAEGSLLLRRNSTQLAQRWNAIKRKIQRAHYAGLDEATKNLAIELVSQRSPQAPLAGASAPDERPDPTPAEDPNTEERRPPTEAQVPASGGQPFHQTLPGPSRVFD